MGTWEIAVVLALVVFVLVLFLREVLPVPITALLAAATLMVIPAVEWDGGILSPEEGLSGFSSQATITVLSMFVLSAGVERAGGVALLSDLVSRIAGKSPRRQVLALGAIAGPLSGFVNNTPVVAVLIPVATKIARNSGHSPSKLLMPLSFFAMMGGTLTLIGTSTNLLGNSLVGSHGLEPFGFFDFTLIGLAGLTITAIYFATVGMALIPKRGTGALEDRFDLKGFQGDYGLDEDGDLVGQSLRDAGLTRADGIHVLRIRNGNKITSGPRVTHVLQEGDVLLIQGSREALERIHDQVGISRIDAAASPEDAEVKVESDDISTAEILLATGSRFEGRTVAESNFEANYDLTVLAVRHRDRVAIGPISKTKMFAGDVLLVQGKKENVDRIGETSAFLVARERSKVKYRKDKILLSLGIVIGVVVCAALSILPVVTAALAGAIMMVLTGCLKVNEFIASIHWDIVLLLAGIIPLGLALEKSGAAALLAGGLSSVGGLMPPLIFLMLVYFVTSLVTEVVSNNASVVLLIPVVLAAAISLGLDGRPFALAVMLSASTSMLTPIGYQTNTMVYAPGAYKFIDYLRVGGPLNLILILTIPFLISLLFPL